ncbi:phosphodiester glycosidase family protein [Microcoleus sp. ZQ-A2]|nr:phosphodiester glycosidase family protein [Microcoleus sp. FACHB-1]
MQVQERIFLLTIVLAILVKLYSGWGEGSKLSLRNLLSLNRAKIQECPIIKNIELTATDNKGNGDEQGVNYVIIFDPKSKDLDFKVNVGLSHKLYLKNDDGKTRQKYISKRFSELISDENSTLNGKPPIAAINADYIGVDNQPQGLNMSKGVEYSGKFKDKRSSFGISGGKPKERIATIQIGKRNEELLNYNVVGGNGRFYQNGKFKNICPDLGDYVCAGETSRSLVATTSKGYVILLVNNANLKQSLYPSMFDDVLEGIASNYCLGNIQDGMLFDGGFSTGLFFDNKIYVENTHPVGSVFLIYKK